MTDKSFDEAIAEDSHLLPDALRAIARRLESDDMVESTVLCQAADELERLRNPWQPIETAPVDGTIFIGAFFDVSWSNSHWQHDSVKCWYQLEFDAFISGCNEMCTHNGHTFKDGTTRRLHSPDIEPVTHWMPLPTPPETTPNKE